MRTAMHRTLAVFAFALCLSTQVLAGPYEDGDAAYEKGDYATALQLYRPLAEQGHMLAQFSLGYMYANGEGLPRDFAEAVRWYRKAADQGNAAAMVNLGLKYEQGQGVPQDNVQAYMWYALSAAAYGNVPQSRDRALKNRDLIAQRMSPGQVAQAQKLVQEWKPKN